MTQEMLQTTLNVADSRNRFPVILGWEVNNIWWKKALREIGDARLYLFTFASLHIIFEHFWETFFELQSDALAHDADTVHSIDECLRLRLQNVCDQDSHLSFLEEHITADAHGQSSSQCLKRRQGGLIRNISTP